MADEDSAALALDSVHISHSGADDTSDAAGQEKERELNQATFFHCVEEQNAKTLQILTRTRQVDVNVFNQEVSCPTSQSLWRRFCNMSFQSGWQIVLQLNLGPISN